jgi:hypothetical protein
VRGVTGPLSGNRALDAAGLGGLPSQHGSLKQIDREAEYTFMRVYLSLFLGLLGGLVPAAGAAAGPKTPAPKSLTELLPPTVTWVGRLEFVKMLTAILKGDPPDVGFGWFHPSQSRYGWTWLARRCDANHDGVITREEFHGPNESFRRLDRDHNGKLTPADFDWSDQSPLVRQARIAQGLFRRGDANIDGRLTAKEWQDLFKQAAGGKDFLTPEEVRDLLFPPPPMPPPSKGPPPGTPTPWILLRGLLQGEIGSPCEGPAVGSLAPDFDLETYDGERHIRLSDYRGKKPVVLVFGNFT